MIKLPIFRQFSDVSGNMGVLLLLEMNFFLLCMLGLASFRLTRLIVFDTITDRFRAIFLEEVTENEPEGEAVYIVPKGVGIRRFIGELISCYWCTGIWVSGFLVALHALVPGVSIWLLAILSVAAVASVIETVLQKLLY